MDRRGQGQGPGAGAKTLKIVTIGGGHGLSTMLRGLKYYASDLTAVVTMADNGGSSGMLRQELGMLPPGDARNCVLALSNAEPELNQLMDYRFTDGSLAGQSLGNLILAALTDMHGSFSTAVRSLEHVLSVTGRVLPVTEQDVHLMAEFADGSVVTGESEIFYYKKRTRKKIRRVALTPARPAAYPESLEAIRNADLILVGPGSLYTSLIPNFLVSGITEAVQASSAVKILVMNLMTQDGETENLSASEHLLALLRHSAMDLVDCCLASSSPIPQQLQEEYRRVGADVLELDREKLLEQGVRLYMAPLLKQGGDYARHDPQLLAEAILDTYQKELALRRQTMQQ